MANPISEGLKKLDETRHKSSIFGDAVDSGLEMLKGLFGAGKDITTGTGGVAGKVVGGTVKGIDRVGGGAAERVFDKIGDHKKIAVIAIALLSIKPIKNFFGHRKEKKVQNQLLAESAQLSIAEERLAARQAYAAGNHNPSAEVGHANRVSAGRGQGVSF